MGAVYLAKDPRFEDFLVAIKTIYRPQSKQGPKTDRFRNEISAAYRVSHKNVVRAYEFFEQGNVRGYVMEYVNGGDLLERMEQGPFTWKETVQILKQVAAGLESIHREGINHRDLKPENIMLDQRGMAKIADFGVARLINAQTMTQDGSLVGTPKYISPEYVTTGECDHRADIYALGVIGYEMLSDQEPFQSDSRVNIVFERLESDVIPLAHLARDCDLDVIAVIEKAMSFSITKRYQTARELREDLEAVEVGKEPPHVAKDRREEDKKKDEQSGWHAPQLREDGDATRKGRDKSANSHASVKIRSDTLSLERAAILRNSAIVFIYAVLIIVAMLSSSYLLKL